MVGAAEALANPVLPVRRLLAMGTTWPDAPPTEHASRPHRTARQLRPAEIDELAAAFQAGTSITELADQYGIYRVTVGRHLRARGLDTSPPPALTGAQVITAGRLYSAGWKLSELAKHFKVGDETVRRYLVDAKVEMRPKGRAPRNLQ